MKNVLLAFFIVISTIVGQAQPNVIYHNSKSKNIRNCSITEVKNRNMVYYVKDNISDSIKAVVIMKNGTYITLDYQYHIGRRL